MVRSLHCIAPGILSYFFGVTRSKEPYDDLLVDPGGVCAG